MASAPLPPHGKAFGPPAQAIVAGTLASIELVVPLKPFLCLLLALAALEAGGG